MADKDNRKLKHFESTTIEKPSESGFDMTTQPSTSKQFNQSSTSLQKPTLYEEFTEFLSSSSSIPKKSIEFKLETTEEEHDDSSKFPKYPKYVSIDKNSPFYKKRHTAEEVAQMRYNIRHPKHDDGSPLHSPRWGAVIPTDPNVTSDVHKTLLNREPFRCSVGVCSRVVGATSIMSHYLNEHGSGENNIACIDVVPGRRSILDFDVFTLKYNVTECLALLCYGDKEKMNHPANRGLCMPNAFLMPADSSKEACLPILVMIVKTTFESAIAGGKSLQAEPDQKKQDELNERAGNYLIILWLVAPETTKPVHGTISAFNKEWTNARSAIVRVRSFRENNRPNLFVLNSKECLRLNSGDAALITNKGKTNMFIEVLINEFN